MIARSSQPTEERHSRFTFTVWPEGWPEYPLRRAGPRIRSFATFPVFMEMAREYLPFQSFALGVLKLLLEPLGPLLRGFPLHRPTVLRLRFRPPTAHPRLGAGVSRQLLAKLGDLFARFEVEVCQPIGSGALEIKLALLAARQFSAHRFGRQLPAGAHLGVPRVFLRALGGRWGFFEGEETARQCVGHLPEFGGEQVKQTRFTHSTTREGIS